VRLETPRKTDKQKSELYFSVPHKNFLTEKNRLNALRLSLDDDLNMSKKGNRKWMLADRF